MIMKYILAFLLMLSTSCWAQVPMTGAGKSAGGVVPPSYTGPGDVVASASAFWSCSRAYTAAYATGLGNACDVADVATGLTVCTMKFAANGFADVTSNLCAGGTQTVPAFCTAHTSCIVTKMYDQTGSAVCTGTCDVSKKSLLAALTFSCIGTIPCVTFPGSSLQYLATTNITSSVTQGCTYIGVAQSSSGTTQNAIVSDDNTADGVYFDGSSAGIFMYAGTVTTALAAANGSPHAFQAAFNAGSSLLNVDSSGVTSVSAGSGACASSPSDTITITGPSTPFLNGIVWEVGLWPVAFSGPQITNMNSNQHTQYGF